MASPDSDRTAARLKIVEEHVQHENNHDLDGILSTFGEDPVYEEQAWNERYEGLSGVRDYYVALIEAMPDLFIDVRRSHVTDETIVLEVVISGTHQGPWRGLPATGRSVEFPLCAVYTFTEEDELAGERIYYDRATVLRQLGVYREPDTLLGRIATAVTHPVTTVRAYARALARR